MSKKPIFLCCGNNGRAVIFGYTQNLPKKNESVTLDDARMILRWPQKCKGLLGLASEGPKDGVSLSGTVKSTTETNWQEFIELEDDIAEMMKGWS